MQRADTSLHACRLATAIAYSSMSAMTCTHAVPSRVTVGYRSSNKEPALPTRAGNILSSGFRFSCRCRCGPPVAICRADGASTVQNSGRGQEGHSQTGRGRSAAESSSGETGASEPCQPVTMALVRRVDQVQVTGHLDGEPSSALRCPLSIAHVSNRYQGRSRAQPNSTVYRLSQTSATAVECGWTSVIQAGSCRNIGHSRHSSIVYGVRKPTATVFGWSGTGASFPRQPSLWQRLQAEIASRPPGQCVRSCRDRHHEGREPDPGVPRPQSQRTDPRP